ncbi:unnamed protein product [Effrenium voratum]|nr:unnamed protein product [Effrenium voratum]
MFKNKPQGNLWATLSHKTQKIIRRAGPLWANLRIAKLWHCPKPDDFDEKGCYAGAGTVGSTEACLLAGLALKFRWRKWYAKRKSQSPDQVRGVYPNLVISTMFQAAWEKLFKYMDIEPRFVKPSYKTFILDPNKLKDYIDDQTIGVVCIMGNHYGSTPEADVHMRAQVDAALDKINAEKGLQVGIHVDAASGGFIAPFQDPFFEAVFGDGDWEGGSRDNLPKWDFRLKNVLSISASGHKFGNSCCGTGLGIRAICGDLNVGLGQLGWVIWRQRKDLSEEVAINVSYLGGSADSYTLNFSRPAQGVYVQFYKLLRLGREGYYSQVNNQMCVAQYLREGLLSVKEGSGSVFTILDAVGMSSQKVVTAMINPDLGLPFDDIDFQHVIAQGHWYVSGYHMSMHHPLTEETMPLFTDQTCDQAMRHRRFRIVVKNNLTMRMAAHLLDEIKAAVAFLINHGKGFQHRKPKRLPTQKSVPVGCSAESRNHAGVLKQAMRICESQLLWAAANLDRSSPPAAMALAVMAPVRPVPMSPPARPARLRVPAPPRARSGAGPGGVKAAAAAALAAKAAAKVCARKSRSLGYAACMAQDARRADVPYYASVGSRSARAEDMELPEHGLAARHCVRTVEDYHLLDFSERLNTSSYVNVVFEPEEERVAMMGLRVNLADQTVYPESFRMHNDTLNMIAKLWHCPKPEDFEEYGCYAGAGTVGSTEACLLAGLALKFRWRKWYAKKTGQSADKVRGVYPNIVISTMFQAAWEKLFKYMDIEPRFVQPSYKTFTLDPSKLKDYVDDQTIGVVCIMGNHYGGQYDPVWEVDAELEKINAEKGLQVGIHVDGASGGFIAPFQEGLPPWDFRLKNVLSISSSGHKFGNSCCGTGWVVWRQRKDLSDQVAINVSYLGGSADSYTLNFSRPAQGVFVQFYKLLRLGREGYTGQVENQMSVAQFLREGLQSIQHNGESVFTLLDAVGMSSQKLCLPVVTAMINPELGLPFDDIDFQHVVAQGHWYVSGYHMSMHHPLTEETTPLFTDQPSEQAMFRIVVKNNLTMRMAANLLDEMKTAVQFLISHGKGFQHRKPKRLHTHKAVPAC